MNAVVFLGPTLPTTCARDICPSARVLPPAERGDVLRAVLAGAEVIGLVDGYFEHRYAVQHKEILWGLKRGVRIFGAASMGALRAAELDSLGMVGVGQIYTDYAAGRLDADDEVAVAHGPGPDYRSGSAPLVNIRATLSEAVRAGVIGASAAAELIERCRRQFYADRSYATLLDGISPDHWDRGTFESLRDWLRDSTNHVNQKQNDAIELLRTIAQLGDQPPMSIPEWDFPWTSAWNLLWEEVTELSYNTPHKVSTCPRGR